MSARVKHSIPIALALCLAIVWTTPAAAWDVQQKYYNETGVTANDLLKILDREVVIDDVITSDQSSNAKFADYDWWWENGRTYIHLFNGEVAPGEWTWACFNFHGSDIVGVVRTVWTLDGVPIDDSGGPVGGGGVYEPIVPPLYLVRVQLRNDWEPYGGHDALIGMMDVFAAVVDYPCSLAQLNEDLIADPSIPWTPVAALVELDPHEIHEAVVPTPVMDTQYVLVWFEAYSMPFESPVLEIWQLPGYPTYDPSPVDATTWTGVKSMFR